MIELNTELHKMIDEIKHGGGGTKDSEFEVVYALADKYLIQQKIVNPIIRKGLVDFFFLGHLLGLHQND